MATTKTLLDFQTAWEALVDKANLNYDSLTPDERIWFNVQCLIGQVDNGGLISHYYNSGADYNKDTIEDLKAIGYPDVANLLIQINSFFPESKPSINIDERNEVINSWPEGKHDFMLEKFDNVFYQREYDLEAALIRHIEAKLISG